MFGRSLSRPLRWVLGGFAGLGALETALGAPQAANWLAQLGVQHGRLFGVLLSVAVALVFGGLAAGPERVEAWAKRRESRHARPGDLVPSFVPILDFSSDRFDRFSKMVEAQNAEEAALAVASRQLGTELRDIRHRVEIVRATRPSPHYSHDFQLPTTRWDQYDEVVARDPMLYAEVERAYAAAVHVNEALRMRRTRANSSQTLGVIFDDGLDEAYEEAGKALDVLKESRGEAWHTAEERVRAKEASSDLDPMTEASTDLMLAKYGQAVLSAYRDILRLGYPLERELISAGQDGREDSELHARARAWCERCLAWANDAKIPLSTEQRLAFRRAPAGPTTFRDLALTVANDVAALRALRELIDPPTAGRVSRRGRRS